MLSLMSVLLDMRLVCWYQTLFVKPDVLHICHTSIRTANNLQWLQFLHLTIVSIYSNMVV